MATKPASGTTLNSGGAFYSLLSHAWAFLEGTGTTTADSKGSDTATFTSSPAPTWGSTAEGPNIALGSAGAYLTLGSSVTIPQETSFSFAWGGAKTSGTDDQGSVLGNRLTSTNILWANGSLSQWFFRSESTIGDDTWVITSGNLTTRNDWCLTAAYSPTVHSGAPGYTVNLYLNGSVVASPIIQGRDTVDAIINTLGAANGGYLNSRSFIGSLEYIYLLNDALPAGSGSTGVGTLATDPYAIFASSSPTTATLSGPTSGAVGVASTNFTITLDQPAEAGGVACVIEDSVGGDTITPA